MTAVPSEARDPESAISPQACIWACECIFRKFGGKEAARARGLSRAQGQVKMSGGSLCSGMASAPGQGGGFPLDQPGALDMCFLGESQVCRHPCQGHFGPWIRPGFLSLIVPSVLRVPWLCDFCLDPLPNGGFLRGPAVSHWASALNHIPGP